ncbi:Death domain-associated protein 6, partial [Stegodyphus mimosarum]
MKSFANETKEDGIKDLLVKETSSVDALLARFKSSNITCKVVNKNLNDQGSSSTQKNICTDAEKDKLAVSEDIQEAKTAKVVTVTLVKEKSSKDVHAEDSSLHEALNAVDRVIAVDEIKSSHSEGQRISFKDTSTKLSLKRKRSPSASDVEVDPKKCITNSNNVFCNGKLVVEQNKEPTENSCKFPVDNKEKFVKLLEFCKPYMNVTEDEEKKIQNNLLKHLNYAHQNFVNSNEFSDLITLTREKIVKDSNMVFVHLNYLQLELKARKQKKNIDSTANHKSAVEAIKINVANQNSSNVSLDQNRNKIISSTSNHFTEADQNLQKNPIVASEKVDSSTTKEIFVEPSSSEQYCSRNFSSVSEISDFQADTSKEQKSKKSDSKNSTLDADARQEIQVKRLERLLRQLDKKIRKLQMKELSLEDLNDEDSTYIMEHKYKQKFNKVWKELCKLKQRSRRTGREMEKTFTYEGSRYTCLNHAVEKMINKRKPLEKFPNYIEIYKLVKNINDTQFLGLDEPSITKLAKKVFQDVVLELKARRERDDEQNLGCYLTDNIDLANDPAEHNETLKEKLSLSIAAGERRIAEIIDKYAEKQPEASEVESYDEHSEKEPDVSEKIETVISDLNIKEEDVGTDLQKMHAEVRLSEGNRIESDNQGAMELIKSSDLPDTDPNSSGSDEFPSLEKQGIVCKEMVCISSDASTEPDCNSQDLKCSSDLKRDSIQNFKSVLSEKLKQSEKSMGPLVVKNLKSALSEKLKDTKETKQPFVINYESDSSSDLPSPS